MAVFAVSKFNGGISFCFKSNERDVLLTSERYHSMAECKADIAKLQQISVSLVRVGDRTLSNLEEVPVPKYEFDINMAGEYFFRIFDQEARVLACSCLFPKKQDCIKTIEYFRRNAANAKISIRK